MDAPEGRGATTTARTTDRADARGPARARPSGPSKDESREQGDAETYAVLGED